MATGFDKIGEFADKGAGVLDSVTSGNALEAAKMMQLDKLIMWSKLIAGFIVFIVVAVYIYKYKIRYNKKALVKQVKGGAVVDNYFSDATVYRDVRGKMKLELAKKRKSCPVPKYDVTSKMGKTDFFTLYEGDDGELYSWDGVHYSSNDGKLLRLVESKRDIGGSFIDPQIMRAWRLEEIKLMESKYKKETFFEKYKDQIITFFYIMGAVGIIWLVTKSIEVMYINMAGAFREVAMNCLG